MKLVSLGNLHAKKTGECCREVVRVFDKGLSSSL